ncbi:MAG: prepilin-type N-terminal cleavage/methylation domain-containing protein [Candidatus Paceibacterota bacterium]|jgi:prepilin-type N-terminal cleavage/methylation domain-containing protein
MIKLLTQKNKGFTLVETLVAISIFTVSVLALMVILGQGISDTGYAKKKMTATYLAQEGIEYMRNMRDTFSISGLGWDEFKNKLTLASCDIGCYFDAEVPDEVISCENGSCHHLLYDSGKYNYYFGVDSGFVRSVRVDGVNEDEIKITSTVSWGQESGAYSIVFSESLFNWIQ